MVGSTCKAKGCTSNKDDNPELSFHSFPRNKERFKLWCESIKRPDLSHGKAVSSPMSMRVCSLHFEDRMYMSPNNKSRLIWCAVPKPVDIKVPVTEEASGGPLLPEPDASENSNTYLPDAEDIIIKEEIIMDQETCDEVSPPSFCPPESLPGEYLTDSKVGILEQSQPGQCVSESMESKAPQYYPESGQLVHSEESNSLGTQASVCGFEGFESSVLPKRTSLLEKNISSINKDVKELENLINEMNNDQGNIVCRPDESLDTGAQTGSKSHVTISVSAKNHTPRQEFPPRHGSKLFKTDSTEPMAQQICMVGFDQNKKADGRITNERKIVCWEGCGCDKCLTKEEQRKKAQLITKTARRTYAGPIRRQIVTTKGGVKKTIMIVKKASFKNLQAKGLIQPIKRYMGNNPSSVQSLGKDIIPVASVSGDNPSNEPGDSHPLKEPQAITKNSSFPAPTNTDGNYEDEDSSTDSAEEPTVSSHATQTPNDHATQIPTPRTTQTSFPHAAQIPKSRATQIPNPQITRIPNLQATQIPNSHTVQIPNQATRIPNPHETQIPNPLTTQIPNPLTTQNPNPESVNQGNQAPVTVSWAPVSGTNALSFTFTVQLPEGANTLPGISHDSLQKATSLLNNTAPCTVSQSNIQDHLVPNQMPKSHSSSNSGISPTQRIGGSKEFASGQSITPHQNSLQLGGPVVSSKPLHPSPVVRTYVPRKRLHADNDTCSTKATTKDISTATITPQPNHHPFRVTLPDLSGEESCEETSIHGNSSADESTMIDEPSKAQPKPKKIHRIALPPECPFPSQSPSPGPPKPLFEPELPGMHQVPNATLHSLKMPSIRSHVPNTLYKSANKELKHRYNLLLKKHQRRYHNLLRKHRILEKKYAVIEDVGTPEQIVRDAQTFLSEEHILFFESQMFLRNRGTGNRFSREFMQLMLKYYNRSGAGYRFLRTIFTMPSVKTVQNWLTRELESQNSDDEAPGASKEHSEPANDEQTNASQNMTENSCQDENENSCQDENPSTANVSPQNVEGEDSTGSHCYSEENSFESMPMVVAEPT